MTVNISKPAINVTEKLAELNKPSGIAGEAMLRAETPQEQFNLISAGRRNLIINGDMRIDQRNGGSSVTGHSKYGVDRFVTQSSNTSIVSQQVADAPDGFYWSLKLTNAGTDNSATTYREVKYVVEGHDISAWDKNNQSLTLSFWVKSSLAGTYQSMVRTDSGTDYFFGISFDLAADTWTKVERVIPPNSNSTLSSDNLAGMSIFIVPHYGTNYTSSASGNWQTAYSNVLDNYPQNWANTSNATFNITGVQLELGKVATPFEHRSYGEELALCQRYYQKHTVADAYQYIGNVAVAHTTTTIAQNWQLNPTMRAAPTLGSSGWRWKRMTDGLDNVTITGTTIQDATANDVSIYWTVGTQTVGHVGMIESNGTSSAYLAFDAEL